MRALGLLLAMSVPALAFDGTQAAEEYYAVRGECRIGETATGIQLTAEQNDQQCKKLEELGAALKANGYCWDNDELEWVRCQ
jgi:hypothetical protein